MDDEEERREKRIEEKSDTARNDVQNLVRVKL
jgi:hypothetical protein